MRRINLGRVILGGLLTGLLINISEAVLNGVVFVNEMNAAMAALNKPPVDGGMIVWFVLLGFVIGIATVWLYAAMRPRFGPGPQTAIIASSAVWGLGYLYPNLTFIIMNLFPTRLMIIVTVWGLAETIIAGVAGAWLYSEAA
jgi:hypothetical protein